MSDLDQKIIKFDYEKNLDNLHKLLNRYKKDIFKKFILVSTVSPNLFKKNFILSGLNLAFLGHYVSKELNIYKNMYHWPDGLFKFLFYKKKYKKIYPHAKFNLINLNSIDLTEDRYKPDIDITICYNAKQKNNLHNIILKEGGHMLVSAKKYNLGKNVALKDLTSLPYIEITNLLSIY